MSRLLNEQEVLHDLRTVGFYLDTGGSETSNGATAAGDLLVNVQVGEGSGFAAGDVIRVGAKGNTMDIATILSIATDALTLKLPMAFAHVNASEVRKQTLTDLGHLTEDGVAPETTQDETSLRAGTQRGTLLFIPGAVEEQFTMGLLGFNPENMAAAYGLDEGGAGVVVTGPTPLQGITINPNDFAGQVSKPWSFEGIREDLKTVTWYVGNAKVAAANVTTQFTTGQGTSLPLIIRSTGMRSVLIE